MKAVNLQPAGAASRRLRALLTGNGREPVPSARSGSVGADPWEQSALIVAITLGLFWAINITNFHNTQWWTAALLAVGVGVAWAVVRGVPHAAWLTLAYAVAVGFADRVSLKPYVGSDVGTATREAIGVLRQGHNPYDHYYNSFGGRVPYPPGEIFFYAIPHAIFGQIDRVDQWAGVGIVLLLAALAWCVGPARAAMVTALYATFLIASRIAMDGSNDTSFALVFVCAVVLLAFSERATRWSVPLFYASAFMFAWALLFKQFAVLIYPFVVLYLRSRGADWRKHAATTVGLAAIVTLPFFLTAPSGFKRNVLDIAYSKQEIWGLNLWAGLKPLAPGLVKTLDPAIPVINFVAVAGLALLLILRPITNLGLALLRGLLLLFVALYLARWTTTPYYTGAGAILAAAIALLPVTPAPPVPSPVPAVTEVPFRREELPMAQGGEETQVRRDRANGSEGSRGRRSAKGSRGRGGSAARRR